MTAALGTIDRVADFAEALQAAQDHRVRKDLLLHALEPFGVSRYCYANTQPRFAPFLLETTYDRQWVDCYLERDYRQADLVPRKAAATIVPFRWREELDRLDGDDRSHEVFAEAAAFRIHDGLTIPIHQGTPGFAMMNLVADDPALLGASALAQRHAVMMISMIYHDAVLRDPGIGGEQLPPRLSPREREVLNWAALGKTSWEISQILKVAERTVVFHVENAKTKLGVASRSHAVAKALALGLITP